ncbi:MRPS5 [Candida oxycetoniae]|uniref:Small ribosomal subunit protein uS5m n=1 Tax=Candida oxycetoniae TaxID=497107 RepID=A0AAI9T1Z7_9ASCO|nr:MRPS5 [Candida oxycetoniae]KAI3407143.2 MRPS5 [Candida oxycetoniae]
MMIKSSGMIKSVSSQAFVIRRLIHATPSLLKGTPKATPKLDTHLKFLKHYYSPELLQSIQIAETLVEPQDYLDLQKKGDSGRSTVAPKDSTFDYSTKDAEWEEPILYPNQGLGRVPYPPIPQVRSPDRDDLRIRFADAPRGDSNSAHNVTATKTTYQIAKELSQLTGLDESYIRNLYIRPLVMKRVSLKTAKGNIPNFFVMSVAGDKNGMLGLGIGKSRDGIRTAATKAHWSAVKNLAPIKRYDNRTILQSFEKKYHASKLKFSPAPIGFGLRCNSNVFEICQAAGIKDIRGKIFKSRNPVLVAKGFVEALKEQKTIEELALNRGKKVVELRKVYYSQ